MLSPKSEVGHKFERGFGENSRQKLDENRDVQKLKNEIRQLFAKFFHYFPKIPCRCSRRQGIRKKYLKRI